MIEVESDHVMYLSLLNMQSEWFFHFFGYHFSTDDSLQSAEKNHKKAVLWQGNCT